MEYMAPEIIRGESDPSTETDLHSLAILLFYLWVWHHPFHGKMEYDFYCWDIPAKKKVYGESPLFVFDPVNPSNRLPDDPDYDTAKERWAYCPLRLQEMFTRAFTDGIATPNRRVTEGEWQRLFAGLRDSIVLCSRCRAENFMAPGGNPGTCWHCGMTIPSPPLIVIHQPGGDHAIAVSIGMTIRFRHISPSPSADDGEQVIARVVPHPAIPGAAGIRNLSPWHWLATFPDGTRLEVPPGRAVPLNAGTVLEINGIPASVIPPARAGLP
jgi:hypothetical protein